MAKVTLAPEFESISGKLCSKSKTVIAVNKQTGNMYRYDDHGHSDPNSTKQQNVRSKFTQKAKAASTWWKANKEVKGTDGTITKQATDDMKALLVAYKAQHKYGSPYNYLRSLITDDLKVTIGGVTKQITVSGSSSSSRNDGYESEEV